MPVLEEGEIYNKMTQPIFIFLFIRLKKKSNPLLLSLNNPVIFSSRNRYYLIYESVLIETFNKLRKIVPYRLEYNLQRFTNLIFKQDPYLRKVQKSTGHDFFVLHSLKQDSFLYRSEDVLTSYLNFLNKRFRRKRNVFNNYFRKKFRRKYIRKLRAKKKKVPKITLKKILNFYNSKKNNLVFFSNFFLFLPKIISFSNRTQLRSLHHSRPSDFLRLLTGIQKFKKKKRWLSRRSIKKKNHIKKSYRYYKRIKRKKTQKFWEHYNIRSKYVIRRGNLKNPIYLISPIIKLQKLLRHRLKLKPGVSNRNYGTIFSKISSNEFNSKKYFKRRFYLICKKKRSNFYFTIVNQMGEVIISISSGRLQKNTLRKRNRKLRSAFFNLTGLTHYVIRSLRKKKIKTVEIFFKPSFLRFYQCKRLVYSFFMRGIKIRKLVRAPKISHGHPPKNKKVRRL